MALKDPDNPGYKPPKPPPAKPTQPSTPRPGFSYAYDDAAEYDAWLAQGRQSEAFKTLEAKYGAKYVAWEWGASNKDWASDGDYFNALTMAFPDWQATLTAAASTRGPGGPGSSGPSLAQQYAQAEAAIRNEASTLGLALKDPQIKDLAKQAVTGKWSSEQLTDKLTGNVNAFTQPGTFQAMVAQIKGMASQQLITISDATAKEWARQVVSGEKDPNAIGAIFMNQAAGEFGWAATQLKEGTTMRDILMPARDTLASELEMDPTLINFNDSKWRNMVTVKDPTGKPRAATLTEVTQAARQDPGWSKTANAGRMAANMATMLRQAFEGG